MHVIMKTWLPVMGAIAIGLVAYLVLNWSAFETTQRLSFIAAILLIMHVLEEERFPGGFGYTFNVVRGNSDAPDRFPMNPLIAMIVDISAFFVLFFPALIWPDVIWLGMAPMYLAILEFVVHGTGGLTQRRKFGYSIYNPGLATAVAFGVVGTVFVWHVLTNGLMSGWEWLWSLLYFVFAVALCVLLPENALKSRQTTWAFSEDEFLGFYKRYLSFEQAMKGPPNEG